MEFKHIKLLNGAVSATLLLVTGWMTKLVQISNKRTCKVWGICIILWTTGAPILCKPASADTDCS